MIPPTHDGDYVACMEDVLAVYQRPQDKTVALRLMDPEGRERIRISVDSNSNARLEFLDEEGSVIHTLP